MNASNLFFSLTAVALFTSSNVAYATSTNEFGKLMTTQSGDSYTTSTSFNSTTEANSNQSGAPDNKFGAPFRQGSRKGVKIVRHGEYTPITSPVPEPETYAMVIAGLALIGFTARRRKDKD